MASKTLNHESEPEPAPINTRSTIRLHHQEHVEEKEDTGPKSTFVDAAAMKEKVRQNLMKPKYNVTDLYHETGVCQAIAKSSVFDKMTLAVIAFNALWIAIDTDMNDSAILLHADPVFIVAENFFCLYFSYEWIVRFMSFKRKLDGFKDAWFAFDSFMVSMMVLETWIFTLVLLIVFAGNDAAGGSNTGVMRLARLLRLSRMARMAKLLRVMPELMIMIKGMKAATRSVFFTLLLLVVIMYVFAIAFVQLGVGTEVGAEFFNQVPVAMYSLLFYGIFLDNVGPLSRDLKAEPVLLCVFLLFVLIGALTVMNMLVGVLCEVVTAVAATEQEEMLVSYVHDKLSRVMALLDSDGGGTISKLEFIGILDNADAVRCLCDVGVDVFALIDLADYIFEDDVAGSSEEIELDFGHFMEVILELRGCNSATVKDIVDLRKFMRLSLQENFKQTNLILQKLEAGAKKSEDIFTRITSVPSAAAEAPRSLKEIMAASAEAAEAVEAAEKMLAYSVESGATPILPKASENGQLLTWIPLAMPPVAGASSPSLTKPTGKLSEDLVVKTDWTPIQTNHLVVTHSNALPIAPSGLATFVSCDLNPSKERGALSKEVIYNRSASKEHKPTIIIEEIPRYRIAGDQRSVGDAEMQALQGRIDSMFRQLAAIMNDALNDAVVLAGKQEAVGKNALDL